MIKTYTIINKKYHYFHYIKQTMIVNTLDCTTSKTYLFLLKQLWFNYSLSSIILQWTFLLQWSDYKIVS